MILKVFYSIFIILGILLSKLAMDLCVFNQNLKHGRIFCTIDNTDKMHFLNMSHGYKGKISYLHKLSHHLSK